MTQSTPGGSSTQRQKKPRPSRGGRQLAKGKEFGPAAFLQRLLDPDEIVYVFVAGQPKLVGYYDYDHLDKLARDVGEHSGQAAGIYYSLNVVDPALHSQAKNKLVTAREAVAETGKSATNDDIRKRRLLLVDFDPIRPDMSQSATAEEKKAGRDKSNTVGLWLVERGWPLPIIVDSGNGIQHLYRIDQPADDGGLVKRVLLALAAKFSDKAVDIDTKVHDARRIAKLPGTMACKGVDTPERPHRMSKLSKWPPKLKVVPSELLKQLADETPEAQSSATPSSLVQPVVAPASVKVAIDRAKKYIDKIPPAVEGKGGDAATFNVAMKLVDDFALPREEARTILNAYSDRCLPPWSNAELEHKLDSAFELTKSRGGPSGDLVRDLSEVVDDTVDELPGADLEPLNGPLAPIAVPDYHWFDRGLTRIRLSSWSNANLRFTLSYAAVWQQQRRDAVIPDVLARAVRWGANYPRTWLQQLRKLFDSEPVSACPEHCQLHNSTVKHRHFNVRVYDKNGELILRRTLEEFSRPTLLSHLEGLTFTEEDLLQFHLPGQLKHPDLQKKLDEVEKAARKSGQLCMAYLPAFVFGLSPAVGLTHSQARLWMAIHGELTRATSYRRTKKPNGKISYQKLNASSRPDRAVLIRNSQVATSGSGWKRIGCPLLDCDKVYVVAGGNNRSHRGKGYRIVHDKSLSWLDWAGYTVEQVATDRWGCVNAFLDDLANLRPKLGLVVAARHHAQRQWKGLDELQQLAKTAYGREWIDECRLRIFLPWDYPVRWRHWLSSQLGYRWIPGGEPCPFPEQSDDDRTDLHKKLDELMKSRGWTRKQLADEFEMTPSSVTMALSGKRKSKKFWEAIRQLIES